MKPRILFIEPDPDLGFAIRQVLVESGFAVVHLEQPDILLDSYTAPDVELVLFGADANHIQIRKLLQWKQKWSRQIPLIVISCYCFQYEAESFIGKGVDQVICKPFDILKFGDWLHKFLSSPHTTHAISLKIEDSACRFRSVQGF